MKKVAVLVTVLALAAFSAPALAMTNPFMDVPMNHWAYDAIGQLAAHGILAGYPDGTYKGQQQTTRYELASSLARALAVVDMTKASKQDVEMMKRLVVEFRDELEALGVRVDELDERVAVFEDRLGGWHIHGELNLDITYAKEADDGDPKGSTGFDKARLYFERRFGEAEEIHFVARLRNDDTPAARIDRFYAEMPFFFDSTLTVGRFSWEWEDQYYIGGDTNSDRSRGGSKVTGGYIGLDDVLTDLTLTGLGWSKNFGLGSVQAYVAHTSEFNATGDIDGDNVDDDKDDKFAAWDLGLKGSFQFTENFGFDLGATAYIGDNTEKLNPVYGVVDGERVITDYTSGFSFSHVWTIFAGLRFNWNENIALKGIFYHQDLDLEYVDRAGDYSATNRRYVWKKCFDNKDDPNHWALIADISQEALTFTSLWLEYGQYDQNFIVPDGVNGAGAVFATKGIMPNFIGADLKYWRIAAMQEWNETWSTHIFYYGYDFDVDNVDKMSEMGLGVQYKLNPSTTMGLNYVHVEDGGLNNVMKDNGNEKTKDDVVRFRTSITF